MFIYIISPFLSFVRCDAIVSFRSPRRCLYVYWVKWGLICYLLKTFSFVSLDEFQPLSPSLSLCISWSCPMSIFFLWNSARHFFHHGLCDLRSSCRISMHQLGCQDLWHTHKLKMEMEMLIKQQRERRNVVDFSTVTIDDLRSWARPLEIETVQLLK